MGKKKFIDKNHSQKFFLLHRSQTDEAHAQEGVPSEFVLVPANGIGRQPKGSEQAGETLFRSKDHINELGLPNDGYDYSKHLKTMGEGKFISKDGSSYELPRGVELPDDVLPSAGQLERDLTAITISDEFMDDDIAAALFEDGDDDGEFEALDDDFIAQAMAEPEEPDFDFDAHIAALIAKSQNTLGIVNKARGWDDEASKGMKAHRRDYDDDEEEDDEDEYFDEEALLGDEAGDMRAPASASTAALDAALDKALEEIDEELDEDDEELAGDLSDEDEALQAALDEFLQEEKDRVYADGSLVRKGARHTKLVKLGDVPDAVDNNNYDSTPSVVDIKAEVVAQEALQAEWAETLQELNAIDRAAQMVDLMTSQAYLREEKAKLDWDCETVLSTYSTLDNHPTVIRRGTSVASSTASSMRPGGKHMNKAQYEEYVDYLTANGMDGGKKAPALPNKPTGQSTAKIVLAGRMGLPEGFGPGKGGKIRGPGRRPTERIAEEEDEGTEEESSEDGSGDEEEEGSDVEVKDREGFEYREPNVGRVKEPLDEKKARKAATKAAKRDKRAQKKQLKLAFKEESCKITRRLGTEQSTERHSVYTYS